MQREPPDPGHTSLPASPYQRLGRPGEAAEYRGGGRAGAVQVDARMPTPPSSVGRVG
jgi:hypothetical protein